MPAQPFGTDDGVVGVLEHGDAVADADAQRAAAPAFADDHADDRRWQPGHFEHVLGDDLGLAAFLGADAGVGPGRVDQADDRQSEFGRQPHLGHRLAIAFRMRAAEVTRRSFLVGPALLMADDHDLELIELGKASANRAIVAEVLVAVQLDELVERQFEVVDRVGAILVTSDLDGLPRREMAVDVPCHIGNLAPQTPNLIFHRGRLVGGLL